MTFSLAASPLLLILCVIAAAVLTYWTYRRSRPVVHGGLRASLIGLRFSTLFIVIFLLFQPILRLVERDERPPVLAVLIDDTQSLGIEREDGLNIPQTVATALRNMPLSDVRGEIRYFRFAADAEPMEQRRSALTEQPAFQGTRTDISRALEQVRESLSQENLRSVLLLSDGLYNTGRNPLYVSETYPVPIHTVVVGDTTQQRDVVVRRVLTNELAYVDVELPVQVNLRAEGFPGRQATVGLYYDGRRVDSAGTTFAGETSETTVELSFTPEEEGLQRLTVHVTEFDEEITHANNRETVTVRVLESKRRLLILSAPPNPDLVAVRQVLAGNPDFEVTTRTQRTGANFYEGPFPGSLDDFDAILLVGYPSANVSDAHVRQVARAAEAGKPLLFLFNRQTDLDLVGRHLGGVLPAQPRALQVRLGEAVPRPTPETERHPVVDIAEVPPGQWQQLPPLAVQETGWEAAPDAIILARMTMRGVEMNDPLIVVSQRRNLRTAALLGAGVWRWANLPEDLDFLSGFWPALLNNTIRWITTAEDDRLVRVDPDEVLFGGGEPVQFTGQVYDESLNPVDRARIEVRISGPDGNEYPFSMESVGSGRYVLDAGSMPEGDYSFVATATLEGTELGRDRGSFSVGELLLEFKETRADAALMRQIATRSGGTFHYADETRVVPATVAETAGFAPVTHEVERQRELWHFYLILFLLIGLLTGEWFLRKYNGMI